MVIVNISRLYMVLSASKYHLRGAEMDAPNFLENSWIKTEGHKIHSYGTMDVIDPDMLIGDEVIDACGAMVLPAFCDSHTHIIYSGSREGEFLDKINGLSYEQIAARGGGILNSADRVAACSENDLFEQSLYRARLMMVSGTGAFEVKSGYGLSIETELKMLRVAARIRETIEARVAITFLGAHAVGRAYVGRQQEYVDMLIRDMLPAVAAEGLADYVDVFCDRGFFTVEQTSAILEAASHSGMRPKIHANELDNSGGVQVGISHNALSVDHLERIGDDEIRALSESNTVATVLPGASFFLGMPYAPARALIDAGAILALASDYNPGSSPSGDMRMVMALACIAMRLSPRQALGAATINGAFAMGMGAECGSIAPGRDASLLLCSKSIPSLEYIPYAYTEPWLEGVWIRGRRVL